MKYSVLSCIVILLLLAGVESVWAKPVTKAERKAAVEYLKHTKKLFLDSVKGLSDEQLKWKAAPDKWSVFEVSEHIALAESFLFDLINGAVMKTPADANKTTAVTMQQIMTMVPDRTNKFQAPEPIRPDKSPWTTMPDTITAFKQRRQTTIDFVDKGNGDMRERFYMNPAFGKEIDAYLWIAFLSAHTERHVKQILEVKANANFPKKKGY
ncbi:MAG: DinB family protein [Pyrinomonadaceae bacterium]|nr:DinB family protein [Acidobacteriota bacterium]MBK7932514.1 DinB family protein [Acidobacteriota bacterium]MBP7375724.1 DinB family protein [Pyrinomonadaceae bacterium]